MVVGGQRNNFYRLAQVTGTYVSRRVARFRFSNCPRNEWQRSYRRIRQLSQTVRTPILLSSVKP
jgi:hypothetical protein